MYSTINTNASTVGRPVIDVPCCRCGRPVPMPEPAGDDNIQRILNRYAKCPDCIAIDEAEHARRCRELEDWQETQRVSDALNASGIPRGYITDRADGTLLCRPVRANLVMEVWKRRHSNIVLAGDTGTGKSTSLCYCAILLVGESYSVRYYTLRELLGVYADCKSSSKASGNAFIRSLGDYDVVIVDEFAGDARISETGTELLFALIDGVADRRLSCRLWLAGNLYRGVLAKMFTNPAPVARRLNEHFERLYIAKNGEVKSIRFE